MKVEITGSTIDENGERVVTVENVEMTNQTIENDKGGKYRLCSVGCEIPHYENCGICFGFGVFSDMAEFGWLPIRAGLALGAKESGLKILRIMPCPECNSTIKGLPEEAKGKILEREEAALRPESRNHVKKWEIFRQW